MTPSTCLQVKLVVVDSVAFPFRHDFTDMLQRTRALGEMGNRLMQLAHSYDVAVCVLPAVSDDLSLAFAMQPPEMSSGVTCSCHHTGGAHESGHHSAS
jgi:RecA/RadA recombinase